MSRKVMMITVNEDAALPQPERFLWLAVVERALKDYCYFFDRLVGADQGDAILRNSKKYKGCKIGYNYRKVLREYDRLNWFIFQRLPEPFNLEYICQQLYEDGAGMAQSFRDEAKRSFNAHVIESQADTKFSLIMDYVRQYENEPRVNSLPKEPDGLRWKRYRVTNSDS